MKESADFGLNKTPNQLHPQMTKEMTEGYQEFPPHTEDASRDAFSLKKSYIEDPETFGSVPIPSTLKGMVKSGVQTLKGNSPSILVDKLGERLAYERTGTRLYDAFIMKCRAADPSLSIATLEQFRDEEAAHYAMVRDCIVAIGGDPTAQTPCADASAVASMGLMQLVNDPRSSIPQCVEAMLTAELTDVAAWDLLIELVEKAGLDEYVESFRQAKVAEDHHLDVMKRWLQDLTLENDRVPIPH